MIKYFDRLTEGLSIGAQEGFVKSVNLVFDILENLDGAFGSGIKVKRVGDQWRIHSDGTAAESSGEGVLYLRSFDIAPGVATGTIKLIRCYYQIGSTFTDASDTAEITPSPGNLCAVINTNTGTVTAAINAVFNRATPELFPVRLFVLDSSGNVTCDCRGSQVVIHG